MSDLFIPMRQEIRKKRRGKPRAGRMNKKDKTILRQACFARDEGICQVCFNPVDPANWHMAHRRNRRMWGDNLDNVVVTHGSCHLVDLHNPKSVPPKASLGQAIPTKSIPKPAVVKLGGGK